MNISQVNYIPYLVDAWDIANRQSKFIINSVRVYEFFGYEYRLPLWDKEFSLFWMSLKPNFRIGSKLYEEFLLNNLFKDYNVSFKKNKNTFKKLLIKNFRKNLPEFMIDKLRYFQHKFSKDENNFNIYINYMIKKIERVFPIDSLSIDHISAIYYLELINFNKDDSYN